MKSSLVLGFIALTHLTAAATLPKAQKGRRQNNQFNPDPAAGFDDPTINIADPSFGTAIAAGYQGPMASNLNPALVGPVDLLRSGHVNYGIKPNLTHPSITAYRLPASHTGGFQQTLAMRETLSSLASTSLPSYGSPRRVWIQTA